MATRDEYIENLRWRLNSLKDEIKSTQKKIQELFLEVETKQEQAQHLVLLLKSENVEINDPELASITDLSISDIVYDFLLSRNSKKAIHYSEITNEIMAQGKLIPGKNPASNLLAHINRDDRFVRIAPGTYGLKEWGLEEIQTKKRKTRRRK